VLDENLMAELLDECPRAPWDTERFPAGRWRRLVAENALLRVVKEGVLQSVAEDFFDEFLLASCPQEWSKWPRVEATAMISLWDAGHRGDSTLIHWRLRELVRRGAIVCDGDLPKLFDGSESAARIRRAG
jgi:hypothetical protein